MTEVQLKYLHCFRDRHGHARYYFRYRGQRWPIPAPGTEGFATAYDGLLAHIKANPFRSGASVEYMPGSLGWVIEKFMASPLYSERAKTTKVNYRRVLDQLRDGYGTGLLRDLEPRHIRSIRNEIAAKSTTGADIAMSLISRSYGILPLSNSASMGLSGFIRLSTNMSPGPQSWLSSLCARPNHSCVGLSSLRSIPASADQIWSR